MPMPATADYFDPARRPQPVAPGSVSGLLSLCDNGISTSQAEFAAFVMSTGGVFTGPQAEVWLDACVSGWSPDSAPNVRRDYRTKFLRPLFHPRFRGGKSLVSTHSVGRGRNFAHFYYKPAYAVLGNSDSRYRRLPNGSVILQRLLLLDYVLQHYQGVTWYGSMKQKMAFFDSLQIDHSLLPSRRYEAKAAVPATTVYFVDSMPIGVSDWRVVFAVALADDRTVIASIKRLTAYEPLWAELRRRGLFVHVGIVLQRVDGGEWQRRVSNYVHSPTVEDRRRLVDTVERYLIDRLVETGEPALARTYGGDAGVSNRCRLLESKVAPLPLHTEPMAVDVWFAERFSAGPWAVPIVTGTQVS